jgi:hypothetical protein
MKSGDTFLYPLDFSHSEHLWIVLTNANQDGFILIVSVTTAYSQDKDSIDTTVQLHSGEHRFINRDSYVYYRGAMIKKVEELRAAEKSGHLKMHDACSGKLIGLVRAGIAASAHCTKTIRKFYSDHKHL